MRKFEGNAMFSLESLSLPDAYPHPVEAAVEVIETHISWVFLAGDFAYKIKKPIKNSFLDYTSLELRKRFCEAELRLNQRFAKDLYLDVVAIVKDHGQLKVDGSGEPAEYAVKMKRFPADALLSHRLDHGLVTLHEVRQLAARIADFHQVASHADTSTRFGSPGLGLPGSSRQPTGDCRVQDRSNFRHACLALSLDGEPLCFPPRKFSES